MCGHLIPTFWGPTDTDHGCRRHNAGCRKEKEGAWKEKEGSGRKDPGSRKDVEGSAKTMEGSAKIIAGSGNKTEGTWNTIAGSGKKTGGTAKIVAGSAKIIWGLRLAEMPRILAKSRHPLNRWRMNSQWDRRDRLKRCHCHRGTEEEEKEIRVATDTPRRTQTLDRRSGLFVWACLGRLCSVRPGECSASPQHRTGFESALCRCA